MKNVFLFYSMVTIIAPPVIALLLILFLTQDFSAVKDNGIYSEDAIHLPLNVEFKKGVTVCTSDWQHCSTSEQ